MAYEHSVTELDGAFVAQDLAIQFVIYDEDATEATIEDDSAVRVDISGWALQFTIRDPLNDTSSQVDCTTAGGTIVITDGPEGEGTIVIADTVTDTLATTLRFTDGVAMAAFMLRRTGAGVEIPLSSGPWPWRQAMARG